MEGRAFGEKVKNKTVPKYYNSQESDIYHKGKTLYLMNFAKRNKLENIIIVEGYMDAIALQKFGFNMLLRRLEQRLQKIKQGLLKNILIM